MGQLGHHTQGNIVVIKILGYALITTRRSDPGPTLDSASRQSGCKNKKVSISRGLAKHNFISQKEKFTFKGCKNATTICLDSLRTNRWLCKKVQNFFFKFVISKHKQKVTFIRNNQTI